MEKSDEEMQSTETDDSHDVPIAKKRKASETQMENDQSVEEMREGARNETSEGLTEMEKSDEEMQSTETDDSHDVPIAKKQKTSETQMEKDQSVREIREGTRNETSQGVTGSAKYESGQILQPKVEQCEESMQNVSGEPSGSTGMENERVVGESEKEGIIQTPTERANDAATNELSQPSTSTNFRLTLTNVVEMVMNNSPVKRTSWSLCDEELHAWMQGYKNELGSDSENDTETDSENEPESDRRVEVEQPEQGLLVQEAHQAVELVHEEAVICDARQERMEEADEMEEPQKYAFRGKDDD